MYEYTVTKIDTIYITLPILRATKRFGTILSFHLHWDALLNPKYNHFLCECITMFIAGAEITCWAKAWSHSNYCPNPVDILTITESPKVPEYTEFLTLVIACLFEWMFMSHCRYGVNHHLDTDCFHITATLASLFYAPSTAKVTLYLQNSGKEWTQCLRHCEKANPSIANKPTGCCPPDRSRVLV